MLHVWSLKAKNTTPSISACGPSVNTMKVTVVPIQRSQRIAIFKLIVNIYNIRCSLKGGFNVGADWGLHIEAVT